MELDLEFDLYDCDLNNVSNQPGSMFAHQNMFYDFYDFEDEEEELGGIILFNFKNIVGIYIYIYIYIYIIGNITPTPSRTEFGGDPLDGPEEFEMTKLLHSNTNTGGDQNSGLDEDGLDCEVVFRRKNTNHEIQHENGNDRNEKMVLSRTSDLTASITSNDLTIRGFDSPTIYYKASTAANGGPVSKSFTTTGYNDDEDELDGGIDSGEGGGSNSGFSETDTLLSTRKASHILNLTHIEDNDICFADD